MSTVSRARRAPSAQLGEHLAEHAKELLGVPGAELERRAALTTPGWPAW
ncbi:MAG TPA: hypothetical protein VMG38_04210 [Trebonia sp.]|nr:hypothetical protein [Trebonia sp.]